MQARGKRRDIRSAQARKCQLANNVSTQEKKTWRKYCDLWECSQHRAQVCSLLEATSFR